MLTSVLSKSLRDRWASTTVAMTIVASWLLLGMAAYQEVDTAIYDEMPEAIRALMGIPVGADPAALAYAVMFGLIASLTLAGLAISMGASSVAGEERDGTIGLLLGNPRSRRRILTSKTAAMVALTVLGTALTLAAGYLVPALLDVEIGRSDVVAVLTHLLLNAVLWGMLATAIGAVTGNRTLASAAAAGVMTACYFLVGLLPLIPSVAGLAKALPWYWFDGHDPLNNGPSGGYLTLQAATILMLAGIAWWGVEARDLRQRTGTRGVVVVLVDRVRRDERAAAVIDRLAGAARVRSIWIKTASEGQALVIITSVLMFTMMGLLMGPIFAAVRDTVASLSDSLPDALLAIAGGGDMTTPEGWYQLETFGLMAPIATTLVAAAVGARALAGEERDRTMGLLLANPIRRRDVVLQKTVAMTIHTAAVGIATFAGVAGGALIAGLDMSPANVAATCLHVTLMGLMFGSVALVLSAATGRVRTATMGTIAVAGSAYAVNALLSVAPSLAGWRRVSPFEWYLGADPLRTGVEWASVGLFVAVTAVLVVAAVALFDRRDLRSR